MNLKRKVYETRSEKIGDFLGGAGLSVCLSVILWCVVGFGLSSLVEPIVSVIGNNSIQGLTGVPGGIIIFGLPCLIQIGLIIYFGLTRHWVALGIASAIALGLLIAFLLAAAIVWVTMEATGG